MEIILGLLLRENIWTKKIQHLVDRYDILLVLSKKIMSMVSLNKKPIETCQLNYSEIFYVFSIKFLLMGPLDIS